MLAGVETGTMDAEQLSRLLAETLAGIREPGQIATDLLFE